MSNQPMDLLPLIPGRDGSQNAARPVREAFQDTLDGKLYPKKVAEYVINYQVDDELKIKENAEQVLQIYDGLNDIVETIENAGREIMEQQGRYMITKDEMNSVQDLKERIRLRHCHLFKSIRLFYVDYFGLLQRSDLLPDVIKKCLDYRIDEHLHLCNNCQSKLNKAPDTSDRCRTMPCENTRKKSLQSQENKIKKLSRFGKVGFQDCDPLQSRVQKRKRDTVTSPFTIIPKKIAFYNCEPGHAYKKTVKLLNTSTTTQSLVTKDFPKSRALSVNLDIHSKLASGMSCLATVVYKPDIYRNIQDGVSFRNHQGFVKRLPITAIRAPPKLIICIFKSSTCHLDRPRPGSARFSEARREALNSSIDCGSCLVGEFLHISVYVQNIGATGKFFIINEDEWYLEYIQKTSTFLEHCSDSLWIYPTFFELDTNDIMEINILYAPCKPEMYLERFYCMCNNNSFQQFEILGDSIMFSKNMLKIDVLPNDFGVEKKEDYCIFLGTFQSNVSIPLILTVHNTSSLILKCYWKIQNKQVKDINKMDQTWIEMEKCPTILAPYSTSDFRFKVNLTTSVNGFYNTFFNFFIADVPLISLEKEEKLLLTEKKISNKMITRCVDVHFAEMEVACCIENPSIEKSTSSSESKTISEHIPSPTKRPRVEFSSSFLEFGILPSGLPIQKPFWVVNRSIEPTKWKIVEVKYNVDSTPYMEVLMSKNISCDSGEFFCVCENKKLLYNVRQKGPISWVSMLLLISIDESNALEIESLCVVTYEMINYDIRINNSDSPVICPMKLLYTGIPYTLTITVENHSPITGMFYFLKSYGESTEFVDVELHPNSAVLKPLQSITVDVKISSNEMGIFENIYVPCFIHNYQECIVMRVLCAVDTVHLAMYLPGEQNYYQKIVWPPKVLFEYDDNWMICPCTLEYAPDFELDEMDPPTRGEDKETLADFEPAHNTPVTLKGNIPTGESLSIKTTNKSSNTSVSGSLNNLRDTLQDQFGNELFLQDYVVEIHQVPLRTPSKITFYVENITPVETTYTVEASNFYTTVAFDKLAHNLKLKKAEDIWNDMIMNNYGILVLPDVKQADLPGCGLIEVNLTIFANTWGIYQEEITVDVVDVPCFTFSLLIEVIGCPVIFPIALYKISELPTIRLGSLAYCSDDIKRKLKVVNTSCIPLKVVWHSFLTTSATDKSDPKFNVIFDLGSKGRLLDDAKIIITDKYYGKESPDLFKIIPYRTKLEENSSEFIDMIMTPSNFPVKTEETFLQCIVLGSLFLEEHHRKKANYFFRTADPVRMDVRATLELPVLRADFICAEATMRFYANDVIFDENYKESTRLVFQNDYTCSADIQIITEYPLEILSNTRRDKYIYVVQPLSPLEITVVCNVDQKWILDLSEVVYAKKEYVEELMNKLGVHYVDRELKVAHIKRNFRILQNGGTQQVFPIDLYIYFPHISAKPSVIKFDQVYLGNTRKTLVTVFNHTGCAVSFEVYKSLASEVLFVTPHYGRIEKSTGVNKSFVNIFIYFTPREARQYQESIRIVTNIANYFIDVSIKATGTLNEKFYVEYKI